MRVIGGTARGRGLKAPVTGAVRPTSDRAREAIFDALTSMGAVEDAVVLDLFAGSGALGIEALSRGARSVTFVEHDRHVLEVIEKNLVSTGFGQPGPGSQNRLVRRDAVTYLANSGHFDLAFVDPPYSYGSWTKIFRHLNADIAVIESDRPIEPEGEYDLYRSYRYGSTLVHIVKHRLNAETGPES